MKKILVIIFLIIIIGIGVILLIPKDNNKFFLDNKYYNTDGKFIDIESEELENLITSKKSFVVFTYLPYCTFKIPCDVVFETFLKENNMSFYSIPYDEFSKVKYFDEVKYAPSVVIVKEGKIVKYLDANSDDDLSMYQDTSSFSDWITKYIKIKK